jgi:hypothetical protein
MQATYHMSTLPSVTTARAPPFGPFLGPVGAAAVAAVVWLLPNHVIACGGGAYEEQAARYRYHHHHYRRHHAWGHAHPDRPVALGGTCPHLAVPPEACNVKAQ